MWLDSPEPDELEDARADPTLRDYAAAWLVARTLKPRTRSDYRSLLMCTSCPRWGM